MVGRIMPMGMGGVERLGGIVGWRGKGRRARLEGGILRNLFLMAAWDLNGSGAGGNRLCRGSLG